MDTLYEVENPLNEDIKIMSVGVIYILPAKGKLENIPEHVKALWTGLHAFLKFRKMPSIPTKVEENIVEKVVVTPKEETKIEGEGVIVDKEIVESKITKVENKSVVEKLLGKKGKK